MKIQIMRKVIKKFRAFPFEKCCDIVEIWLNDKQFH